MRPNTPHLVVTPQASICHGSHFYASSTLRSTCHGILHTFIASSLLTNTEHTTASRELLRRLLGFYLKAFLSGYVVVGPAGKTIAPKYKGNIPDIFTFDGLLDVLSLCNLMDLGNIIHYKTYTAEGMSSSERRRMITGRVKAREVRDWLAANIEIHHPSASPSLKSLDQDVVYPYLCSQAVALVHYKKRAPTSGAQGHVEFQLKDLVIQIDRNFARDPGFQACYDLTVDPKTFDWVGTQYQVRPIQGYRKPSRLDHDGRTFDDLEWLKAQQALMIVRGVGQDIGSKPVQDHGKSMALNPDGISPDDLKWLQLQPDFMVVEGTQPGPSNVPGESEAGHRRTRCART